MCCDIKRELFTWQSKRPSKVLISALNAFVLFASSHLDLLEHGAAEAHVDPRIRRRVERGEEGEDDEYGVHVVAGYE